MRRTRVKKKAEPNWRPILASFVATEKTRYTLNYVYRTKNMYVGCDGKAMGIVCGEQIDGAQFLHAKAFRDVDAAITAAGLYPNFMQAVPNPFHANATIVMGVDKFHEHSRLVAELAKVPGSILAYTAADKANDFSLGVQVGGQCFPPFTTEKKEAPWTWAFDTALLNRAMMLAKARSEANGVTIELHGQGQAPIVIRWQHAGELALVMPTQQY